VTVFELAQPDDGRVAKAQGLWNSMRGTCLP